MNLSSVWTLALFLLLDLYYQQHLSDSLDPLLPPCLKAIIFRRVILRLKHVYSIKYVTGRVALLLLQKNFMNLWMTPKVPFLLQKCIFSSLFLLMSWFFKILHICSMYYFGRYLDIILHAREAFSSPLRLEIGSSGRINLMPAWNWLSKQ